MLAAKASLCTRVDALGDEVSFDLGAEHKVKLESKLRLLEEGNIRRISGTPKAKAKFEKFHAKSEVLEYPAAADSTLPSAGKRRHSEIEEKPLIEEIGEAEALEPPPKKKKKKKNKQEIEAEPEEALEEPMEPEGGNEGLYDFFIKAMLQSLRTIAGTNSFHLVSEFLEKGLSHAIDSVKNYVSDSVLKFEIE